MREDIQSDQVDSPVEPHQLESPRECIICQASGESLHVGLKDRLLPDQPETWRFVRCSRCGHVWLSPRYDREHISQAYEGYSDFRWTGEDQPVTSGLKWKIKRAYYAVAHNYKDSIAIWHRIAGFTMYSFPVRRWSLSKRIAFLDWEGGGRLLDVGSGSGRFLDEAHRLGWEVEGVELDPQSVEKTRVRGFQVRQGHLEEQHYPDGTFDAVTMSHVLEHLHDPISTLRECYRILKPGGRLVIVVPNIEGLGHKWFEQNWFHLDPPRHLHLFTTTSLTAVCEQIGINIERSVTLSGGAALVWLASSMIRRQGFYKKPARFQPVIKTVGMGFYYTESFWKMFKPTAGEEILLIARK